MLVSGIGVLLLIMFSDEALIRKFTLSVLKTLAQFILILISMRLTAQMLILALSLLICRRICMRLLILILKMLVGRQHSVILAMAGLLKDHVA
jgi:hypothetical protein